MEKSNKEIKAKSKVLRIGDRLTSSSIKEPFNFKQTFKTRLQQLILGTPYVAKKEEKEFIQYITLQWTQVNPQTRHYHIQIEENVESDVTKHKLNTYYFWSRTIDPRSVLRIFKGKLKQENWISANVLEKRVQEKNASYRNFWKFNDYIYETIIDTLREQDERIVNYVQYLQEEYRKV